MHISCTTRRRGIRHLSRAKPELFLDYRPRACASTTIRLQSASFGWSEHQKFAFVMAFRPRRFRTLIGLLRNNKASLPNSERNQIAGARRGFLYAGPVGLKCRPTGSLIPPRGIEGGTSKPRSPSRRGDPFFPRPWDRNS